MALAAAALPAVASCGPSSTEVGTRSRTTGPEPVYAPATASPGSGQAPTRPGTYRYRQTGQLTFGAQPKPVADVGTLEIEPPDERNAEIWRHDYGPDQQVQQSTIRFGLPDPSLTLTEVTLGNVSMTCTYLPPSPVPWPPEVGDTYGGTAECSGTVTARGTGRGEVLGTEVLQVDGRDVLTYKNRWTAVIEGTTENGAPLQITNTHTGWEDPATMLDLRQETRAHGRYGPVEFTSTVDRVLLSMEPT